MNLIDLILTVTILLFIANYKQRFSFIYYLLATLGGFSGLLLSVFLAPVLLGSISSDLQKGVIELVFIFVLSGLFYFLGAYFGKKLRIAILSSSYSNLYKADMLLCIPYKILSLAVLIVLLAQILVYVPILSLQYLAQGSSILYAADKLTPDLFIRNQAKKVAPDQFRNLQLDYDPNPLTYNNIRNAGEFQKIIDSLAPSVVKVSGRSCVGLGFGSGFVVAPNMVVTNAHVITGSSTVYISDHDGSYPATPVLIDMDLDLAVLYSRFIGTPPVPIYKQKVAPGSEVFILGYPAGGDLKLTSGLVNKEFANFISNSTKLKTADVISLSAPAMGGNSGGPALNSQGEVIGVVSAVYGSTTIAISSDLVIKLADQAKSKLFPSRTNFCEVGNKYY